MRTRALIVAVVATLAWIVPGFSAELYWSEDGNERLCRSAPDGSSWQVFVSGAVSAQKPAVDDVNRYLYWPGYDTQTISRTPLSHAAPEVILDGLGGVTSLALDLAAGKLYWISAWGSIGRSDLDGSNPETLISGLSAPQDIALDLAAGKMYFGDLGLSELQRANLDGTAIETLVTNVNAAGVALDPVASKVYWADQTDDYIGWADLDGSNAAVLIGGLFNPGWMAIEPGEGKLYWTESSTVRRADLDGTNVETVVAGLNLARGVAFDLRDVIMSDGFESGDVLAWSSSTSDDLVLTCPDAVGELSPIDCTIEAIGPNGCLVGPGHTCGGVLTDCTSFHRDAFGEDNPPDCRVEVEKGLALESTVVAIDEINEIPVWDIAPGDLTVGAGVVYDENNGIAVDGDLPNSAPTEPGYLTCGLVSSTCSFPTTVTGAGAGGVSCHLSFTAGGAETCGMVIEVSDGFGATVSDNINVTVSGP
ncbi:MAG: hypothetical protein PVG53_10580 [Holophagae bacterium]|jgi:hypothetical protein